MLSTIITVILVCVILSIIVGLILSAVRLYTRHERNLHAHAQTTGLLRISALLPALDESPTHTEQHLPTSTLPASLYRHRRALISSALLLMLLLGLFVQSGLADGAIQSLAQGLGINTPQHLASFDISTEL